MAEIGIVCGLASEARALGRWARVPGIAVAVTGARAEVAEAEARRLAAGGARLLLSWGMAGGLAPALAPGDLVFGRGVVTGTGAFVPLVPPPGRSGRALLGADRPVLCSGRKARLHAETGAVAVDLESLAVARAAAEFGVPGLAMRAIADPAGRSLPRFVLTAVAPGGRPRPGRVLAGLVREPRSLPMLWQLGGDARQALRALRRFAETELGAALAEVRAGR